MATRSKTKTQARQASADKRPKAIAKYVRISPRKVKIVIDLIRGKNVDEAAAILTYTPKAASPVVLKVLNSAIANAVNNQELDRKELLSGRVKSQEEKILYSVDTLHSAITAGNQVRFKFCDWDLQKQMVPRHEGQLYTVSPWVMVWENGNYYMIAYTEGRLKHYRVDKMRKVELLPDTEREGAEEYAEFDVNQYMQQMFDMFNGPVRKVTMRCENRLAGAMIDRFGTGVTLVRNPDGDHFNVVVNVQVSPRFYGWVAGFGTGIEILDPPSVRAEMKKKLDELEGLYR